MNQNCVEYEWVDDLSEYDRRHPVQCPVCKGFLKWDDERQPICNKCHTQLVAIPDSESDNDFEFGKVCVLKPLTDVPKPTPEEKK